MKISLRALRAHLQNNGHAPPPLTPRQRDTRARILTQAQCLMAEFGAKSIKFTTRAEALRISPATLRFHFADLDDLLATLLTDHLQAVTTAIVEIPDSSPNAVDARRDAYLAATRAPSGDHAEPHRLLVRDRATLPPDEQTRIETLRDRIGTRLAAHAPEMALTLLDTPHPTPSTLNIMWTKLLATAASPKPAPAPGRIPLPAPTKFFMPPSGVLAAASAGVANASHQAMSRRA